jgi:hypothetical protein
VAAEQVPRDWSVVIGLLKRIRTGCEVAAREFGFVPPENDGLAAIKFIFDKIMLTTANAEENISAGHRKSGPHEATKQFVRHWKETYGREKQYQRASPETLAKWIAELKDNERAGQTKSGKRLSAFEREQIREYRLLLEKKLAARKSKKTKIPKIASVKRGIAEALVKAGTFGWPHRGQDAVVFIDEKMKRASRSVRGKSRHKPARK